jgi:hypothetical protein
MSGFVQKVKDKLSNNNERDTSDTYGSGNQAAGQAGQGGGQYPGRVGESQGEGELRRDASEPQTDALAEAGNDSGYSGKSGGGDSYVNQAGGYAAGGGGQYQGSVGQSNY